MVNAPTQVGLEVRFLPVLLLLVNMQVSADAGEQEASLKRRLDGRPAGGLRECPPATRRKSRGLRQSDLASGGR